MTQFEYDVRMNELNFQQISECEPIEAMIQDREREKLSICAKINELRRAQDAIKQEVFELSVKRNEIKKKYHALKHKLAIENPKSEMEREEV